jgi:glycosyltransferase involved in cell wall biosynthesis
MVSDFAARELSAPPERTRVVYGGADAQRLSPDPAPRRDSVLFVGRITPHKGIDTLIRALPAGATLLIVGTPGYDPHPPERDYPALLARLAEGRRVQFLGGVDDDRLAQLYRNAAAVVLPSVDRTCYGRQMPSPELLGLVVLEAMACGTPVVCSNVGALPEIVQDQETGFLVEPGNVEQLRERLRELLADPGLVARLGGNGREAVLQRFTWKACAERCLGAYS